MRNLLKGALEGAAVLLLAAGTVAVAQTTSTTVTSSSPDLEDTPTTTTVLVSDPVCESGSTDATIGILNNNNGYGSPNGVSYDNTTPHFAVMESDGSVDVKLGITDGCIVDSIRINYDIILGDHPTLAGHYHTADVKDVEDNSGFILLEKGSKTAELSVELFDNDDIGSGSLTDACEEVFGILLDVKSGIEYGFDNREIKVAVLEDYNGCPNTTHRSG